MSLLRLDGVSVVRAGRVVLDRVSAWIGAGELVGLLGPNGAGKTTLLRAAIGLQSAKGAITLGDRPLSWLSRRDRALRAAYIPQDHAIAWPLTVEALVALGRTPFRTASAADAAAVGTALARMDLAGLRLRRATDLSGGERARVLIARALAQDAPLLLADEPTAGLDPAHALMLMAGFRDLARDGHGVLVSLHDLGLAARFCDRLILLEAGRIAAEGPPGTVLTVDLLASVYGITAHIGADADGPILQPTGLAAP